MGALLACPFCRQLYSRGEARRCPACELDLVDLGSLPLSAEALAEQERDGRREPAELQRLGIFYAGRGRGLLLLLSALGLGGFFLPWVVLERPEAVALSGFDLARTGVSWLFGGAVAWFLLVPLLWTRRTVVALRGVRAVVVTAALMTVGELVLLLAVAPTETRFFSSGLSYAWGRYLSLFVALAAALFGTRLGGSLQDLRDVQPPRRARSELRAEL